MSIKWLNQVWSKSPYKGAARLVHLNLAERANDEGISWPSKRRILKDCSLKDEEYLREIFVMMETDNLLYREFRDGRSTNYHLQPIPDPPDTDGRCIPTERGGGIPTQTGVVSRQSTALEPSLNPHLTQSEALGTFEEEPVSDADIPKTGISTPSKANALATEGRDKSEGSKNENSFIEEIIEIANISFNPVSESSSNGAKEILESSDSTNSQPVESDEGTSGTDNLTEQGNLKVKKLNLAPETINQRIMLQKFGLAEFPSQAFKSAFIAIERKSGGQALENLVLKAYGGAQDFQEAMRNLNSLI